MEGGTTFHFLDATPRPSKSPARRRSAKTCGSEAVRPTLGSSSRPTWSTRFTSSGAVLFGRGVRLWDGLEGIEKDYDAEAVTSPSGVTHLSFTCR